MDFTTHPDHHSSDPPKKISALGCVFGCLGLVIGIPLVLGLIGYIGVFHTSLPLKWVADQWQENGDFDGQPIQIEGVGGSLASGFSVDKIVVGSGEETSQIKGLKFRYSGLWDSIQHQQFVIKELSAESADFVVGPDFFNSDTSSDQTHPDSETDSHQGSTTQGGDNLGLFELQELKFSNFRLRSTDGSMDISIPLIHLSGLRIEGDDFVLDEFEVDGDDFDIQLVDASPETIQGQVVPFSRRLQVKLLPSLHSQLKSEINISIDFAAIGGDMKTRSLALNGAFEQIELPDGSQVVQMKNMTLGDYFHTDAHELPERVNLTTRQTGDIVTVENGEFFLGQTKFEITEQTINSNDPIAALTATSLTGPQKISALIRPETDQLWPPLTVNLTSKPERKPHQLLSLVYFHKPYQNLSSEQRILIDEKSTAEESDTKGSPSEETP